MKIKVNIMNSHHVNFNLIHLASIVYEIWLATDIHTHTLADRILGLVYVNFFKVLNNFKTKTALH